MGEIADMMLDGTLCEWCGEYNEVRLQERMQKACDEGTNLITAGRDGERVLFNEPARGVLVRRLPDDPDRVLRISIGCPEWDSQQAYLVFRGESSRVYDLLRKALKAMQSTLPELQAVDRALATGEDGGEGE